MTNALEQEIVAALRDILADTPAPASRPPVVEHGQHDNADLVNSVEPVVEVTTRELVASRQPVRLVAAIVVALAVLGVVAAQRRGIRPGGSPEGAASTVGSSASVGQATTEPSSTPPPTPSSTTEPPATTALSRFAGWYLPTALPNGYEVTHLSAVATKPPASSVEQRWVTVSSPSGSPTGSLSLMSFPVSPEEPGKPPRFNATVHGIDAVVFDSGEGIVVSWQEGGRQRQVRGIGLSQAATLAAAQAVVVDGASSRATMAPGSEYVPVAAAAAPSNALTLAIDIAPSDGSTEGAIHFSSSPNDDGETLDTIKQRVGLAPSTSATIKAVAGKDRLSIRHGATRPPSAEVVWIQDGFVMGLDGVASEDDLLTLAGSVRAVDRQTLVDEQEQSSHRLHAQPTLDAVTLADGTSVTVKTLAGRVTGLCVEAPVVVCRWSRSDVPLGDARPSGAYIAVRVSGRTLAIAWHEGAGVPSLTPPAGVVDPNRPVVRTSTITQTTESPDGAFVEIVVPDGEDAPPLFFGDQDAVYTTVGGVL